MVTESESESDERDQPAGDRGHEDQPTVLSPVVTSVRIWRALLFVPYLVAVGLAVAAVKLGVPLVALLVVFAAALLFLSTRRDITRYRFDDHGRLFLEHDEEPVDWDTVAEVRVKERAPRFEPRGPASRIAPILDVRITFRDGTAVRFARGDHLLEGPASRRALAPKVFPRWLRARAREAALVIDGPSPVDFVASRRP